MSKSKTGDTGTCPAACCVWTQQEDCNDWNTGCGTGYWFDDKGPKEECWKFCPFCGRKIEIYEGYNA